MAVTFTLVREYHTFNANHKKSLYDVVMDSSYPTGGEDLDLTDDFAVIDSAEIVGDTKIFAAKLFTAKKDAAAGHVKVLGYTEALVEIGDGSNLTDVPLQLLVEGLKKDAVVSENV